MDFYSSLGKFPRWGVGWMRFEWNDQIGGAIWWGEGS